MLSVSNCNEIGFCEELADWVSTSSRQTNINALNTAQNAFIDTIGCIYAGSDDESTLMVLKASNALGSGNCFVFGHKQRLPAAEAAMVNGTAAHALDYDDNFIPAVTHASAVLIPALIALGQEESANGYQLLDAYIIGLEIQAQLGRILNPSHYGLGWHATATIGAIGATAACCRLLKLTTDETLNAISISTSMAGGSKKQFGTMTKPLHAGLAARSGITATRLAQHGVGANKKPFVGLWGFSELFTDKKTISYHFDRNRALSINTDGLAVKKYPCCASSHRTLDSIINLMENNGIKSSDILSIETTIPDTNFKNLRFENPKNECEARFSMQYCASLVAKNGVIKLSDFTKDSLECNEIKKLMKRVKMFVNPISSKMGESIWERAAETKIIMKNNEVFSESNLMPVGTIEKPFSEEDIYRKFYDCSVGVLQKNKIDFIYNNLTKFIDIENINSICI